MASELRVNTSTNRVGLGTITYTDTGPIISGITTGNNFKTGTTNVHSTGVELVNINTAGATATFGGDLSIPDTIVHTGDTNTKIRFSGADTIQLETGGSNRLKIDANGVVQVTRRLELTNSGDNHYIYQGRAWAWSSNGTSTGTIRGYLYGDSSGNLRIGANSDWGEDVRITSAGKVGINSTSPTYALEVDGGTQNTVIVARSSDAKAAISFLDNTTGGYGRASIGGEGTEVYITSGTGGAEALRIDSNGNLLVNRTSWIDNHFDNGIYLAGSTQAGMKFMRTTSGSAGTWDIGIDTDRHFKFVYAGDSGGTGAERLRIATDGEVFIGANFGTSNRSTLLSISGANQDPTGVWTQVGVYSNDSQAANKGGSIGFGGQDGSTSQQQFSAIKGAKENGTSGNYAGYMAFYTRPAGAVSGERLRITSTGNIGINVSDPDSALELRSTAASYTPVIKLSNHHSGAWAGGIKFESNHNGTIYESSAIYGYGGSGSSDGILAIQTRGTERLRVNAKGQSVVSPSGSMGSASGTASLSLVQTGNYGGVYPGISIKSLSTGGNGMSIFSFDSNWDLYSRSNNQTGLGFLKNTEANSANARMVIGDDGKTCVGTDVYARLSTSRHSNTAFHVAGGALSIGPIGNSSSSREGGRYCLGWYMTTYINSHSYIHLVTNMWGGGSPNGNTMYIMGGFHIHGHQYSGSGVSEERIYFHNWGNTLHGHSRHHTGTWDPGNAAYINSSGYVTLRLTAGNYRGYIIDTVQFPWYNIIDWTVTAATTSNSSTL